MTVLRRVRNAIHFVQDLCLSNVIGQTDLLDKHDLFRFAEVCAGGFGHVPRPRRGLQAIAF
jgi:hypothetical protein